MLWCSYISSLYSRVTGENYFGSLSPYFSRSRSLSSPLPVLSSTFTRFGCKLANLVTKRPTQQKWHWPPVNISLVNGEKEKTLPLFTSQRCTSLLHMWKMQHASFIQLLQLSWKVQLLQEKRGDKSTVRESHTMTKSPLTYFTLDHHSVAHHVSRISRGTRNNMHNCRCFFSRVFRREWRRRLLCVTLNFFIVIPRHPRKRAASPTKLVQRANNRVRGWWVCVHWWCLCVCEIEHNVRVISE